MFLPKADAKEGSLGGRVWEGTQPWRTEFALLVREVLQYGEEHKAWVSIQPLLLTGYVTSGKFPAVSEPRFPPENGDIDTDSALMGSTYSSGGRRARGLGECLLFKLS